MKINSEEITFTKDELNKIYNESSEEKRKALKEIKKELEDWLWQNLTKAIRVGDLEMGSIVTIAQITPIALQIMMIINK